MGFFCLEERRTIFKLKVTIYTILILLALESTPNYKSGPIVRITPATIIARKSESFCVSTTSSGLLRYHHHHHHHHRHPVAQWPALDYTLGLTVQHRRRHHRSLVPSLLHCALDSSTHHRHAARTSLGLVRLIGPLSWVPIFISFSLFSGVTLTGTFPAHNVTHVLAPPFEKVYEKGYSTLSQAHRSPSTHRGVHKLPIERTCRSPDCTTLKNRFIVVTRQVQVQTRSTGIAVTVI